MAFGFVELGFGIVGGIEFVGGAVDDGVEFVVDGDFVGELELPFLDLVKEFNHHRDFHGAGGVKGVVGVKEEFGFAVEGDGRQRLHRREML